MLAPKTKKLKLISKDELSQWTVEAFIIGDLALHASRVNAKNWTVTHVPTLMSFKSVVPPEVLKHRDTTLKWMTKVQKEKRKDWEKIATFTREQVLSDPSATKAIRGRIRKHCLSIKE